MQETLNLFPSGAALEALCGGCVAKPEGVVK